MLGLVKLTTRASSSSLSTSVPFATSSEYAGTRSASVGPELAFAAKPAIVEAHPQLARVEYDRRQELEQRLVQRGGRVAAGFLVLTLAESNRRNLVGCAVTALQHLDQETRASRGRIPAIEELRDQLAARFDLAGARARQSLAELARRLFDLSLDLCADAAPGTTLARFAPFTRALRDDPSFKSNGPAGSVLNPVFEYR
jgi:hypothetical protein